MPSTSTFTFTFTFTSASASAATTGRAADGARLCSPYGMNRARSQRADIGDLLIADRMRHPVRVPVDRLVELGERIAGRDAELDRHDRIVGAVRREHGRAAIRFRSFGTQQLGRGNIGRERDDAGEAVPDGVRPAT